MLLKHTLYGLFTLHELMISRQSSGVISLLIWILHVNVDPDQVASIEAG